MSKRIASLVLVAMIVMLFIPLALFAQEKPAEESLPLKESNPEVAKWAVIIAGLAMAIASSAGAFAQSKAVITACKGIARNPGATKDIRGALLIGLVLIESLILYTLVVVFVKL